MFWRRGSRRCYNTSPLREIIRRIRRFTVFTGFGAVSFAVAEAIIAVGYTLFGRHLILGVEAIAAFTSVTTGFMLNEKITMRGVGHHGGGVKGLVVRLLKYQLVYLLGNAISVATQLGLLYLFGLSPSIGNILGSGVALPVNYVVSSKLVWSVKGFNG
ncbi:MAG: GtrA family protein [Thermoprotei archaeon]